MKKKVKFKLRSISPVILSPRMQGALYKSVDFCIETENNKEATKQQHTEEKINDLKEGGDRFCEKELEKYNIIYPFYSHSDRYNRGVGFPYVGDYYIPGSSLKGALTSKVNREKLDGGVLTCTDIRVKACQIGIFSLNKVQYLYPKKAQNSREGEQQGQEKIPKLEEFFPNIGVEHLKSGQELTGEMAVDDLKILLDELCNDLNKLMRLKIQNYKNEMDRITKLRSEENQACFKKLKSDSRFKISFSKSNKDNIEVLEHLVEELNSLEKRIDEYSTTHNKKAVLFLGGYKGLLGSISENLENKEEFRSAFYIDKATNLPFGIVEIEFCE